MRYAHTKRIFRTCWAVNSMQYNNTNMYQSYVSFCIGHIKKYINNIMKPNTHSGDSVAKIFGRHKRDIQRKIAIANGFGQKRNNFVITANSFEYAKVLLESGDEKKIHQLKP